MAMTSLYPWQAYGRDSTYVTGRLYRSPGGGSSGSLHSTTRSGKSHHSYIPFVQRYWAQQGPGHGFLWGPGLVWHWDGKMEW